ncbi:GNAT family N-acetyltransferase [Pseudomonas sp. P8_241]|nr:GNAT family N-acetyltransferase [Pseudomonas sp. P8_241]WPN45855.1 GNAT family N-acetyltransferase [Pseudomonas sp. P8_241]
MPNLNDLNALHRPTGSSLVAHETETRLSPQPCPGDSPTGNYPQQMVMSAGKRHPLRPVKPDGEVYRRFDARLGVWVSLRTLDIEKDLARFNRWQNNPRVASFWQEEGSLEQHREYLSKLETDPHTLMLIGCFGDQPFAYFEAYWTKEDRIAPFYDAADYDRGVHMLVGEENHRGPHKVASWLSALVHYLFLDESRTQRVVAEPRADNAKMIGYMQDQGFHCEKEFDFPHKRAALMVLGRKDFFDRCELAQK